MERLLAATAGLKARPWCISQAGFTSEAITFAAENKILVSAAANLAALARLGK
ncbi:MAG: hypothetical protein IPO15_12730 [Anaerolineae bacterium]|nr:hypothetical protein [Anaerolineae bacterium]MBK9231677.1 hypothetical protein [Anaerolineae bacterium]